MDIKEYRSRYEAELAGAAAATVRDPSGNGASFAPGSSPIHEEPGIPGLLAALQDVAAPPAARVAALDALKAARFLG